MISSTAVYPSLMGDKYERDASLALAESSADFDNKSVAILNAEEQLKQHPFQYVILRCSGLVDAQRHPSRFVSHLKSISRLAPANMLHKSDAIGVIQFAIERLGNEIINVSTPNTVSKAEFYQQALIKTHPHLNSVEHLLPLITDTPDKRINSKKSERLGYRYHYQNTLDLL
jgi:nucleoside-diphosphate-sugar epimerase